MAVLVVFYAQGLTVVSQTNPRKIEFAKLSDYVNDWDKRRDGERFVVTDVPSFSSMKFERRYNMYSLVGDENGDVSNTFYTSPTLAKSLRQYLKNGAASERIYCTLIQFAGDSDVYRSPFATKVEGLDENGKLSWTAIGPPPAKLRMRQ